MYLLLSRYILSECVILHCARCLRTQKLCERRGGRPGLSVPTIPCGRCGRKTTWTKGLRTQKLCERRGGRPGFSVPTSPRGLCGRKTILAKKSAVREIRSCVKDEVAVLDSPSLLALAVSVDVKQRWLRRVQSERSGAVWKTWKERL